MSAVNNRSYWVRMLMDLNDKFDSDVIWLTMVEPLKKGQSLSLALTPEGGVAATGTGGLFPSPGVAAGAPDAPAAPVAAPKPGTDPTTDKATDENPYVLRIMGLYRKNEEGNEVVYRYARALAGSEFFAVENIADNLTDYCRAESGAGEEERYAYRFELRLPLKAPMQIK
jgi:hypothetical protein